MPEECRIYLALGLCATQQRKSSKSHYYYSSPELRRTHIQFDLTHAILVLLSSSYFFHSLPFPHLTAHPTQKKVNLISGIWAPNGRRDRKSKGGGPCASQMLSNIPSNQHDRKIACDSTHWGLSQFLFKSITSRRSFLYKIHHTDLLSQEHSSVLNIMETHNMKNECLLCFFHYYWCISNGRRFPMLLLLCTTCFIKEPIKNLNPVF